MFYVLNEQGQYSVVKKCIRRSDKKCFAVKETRSGNDDWLAMAAKEYRILKRLNLAENPNIVRQVAFYHDRSKQEMCLVMEALNGFDLQELLTSESVQPDNLNAEEETKEPTT